MKGEQNKNKNEWKNEHRETRKKNIKGSSETQIEGPKDNKDETDTTNEKQKSD